MDEIEPRMKLATALRVCFDPEDEGWTVAALRTEIRKGTLQSERVAGKIVVTRSAIREMLVKCRDLPKDLTSTSGPEKTAPSHSGSSGMDRERSAQDAALAIVQALKKNSANISRRNTPRRKQGGGLTLVSSRT